jgi:hypothetical protein
VRALRAIATFILIAGFGPEPRVERLPVERYALGNGLVVILAPDASVASVAVHVRYDADQAPKLEAQLGAGSLHVKDFAARIDAVGGWATTLASDDSLGMTEHVPAHALSLALWLEAERMAGLADAIEDSALRRIARERIAPNHATLVIAGRFDTVRTRELVSRYFGWIPPRDGAAKPHKAGRFDPALAIAGEVLAARLTGDVRIEITPDRDMIARPVDGRDPAQMKDALGRELRALRTQPPKPDEITRARDRVITRFYLALEHLSIRAELLASWTASERDGALVVRWPELLAAVKRDDVLAAAASVRP